MKKKIEMIDIFGPGYVSLDAGTTITDTAISGASAAIIYLLLPDILTKMQTVLLIGYFTFMIFALIQHFRGRADRIRQERASYKIRKRRYRNVDFRPGPAKSKYYMTTEKDDTVKIIYM